jgi:5'-nucleotidase
MLTIAVSSRALFHIEDGNQVFLEQGQEAFDAYMRSKENTPLRPGAAFGLVRKLLALNTSNFPHPRDRVEVVMLSRNSPDAGMRVMNSISHYGLEIERAVFCQGTDRFRYAKALGAHLFLSATPADVKAALNNGVAAATLIPKEGGEYDDQGDIRIAFDGDSVLFSSEADDYYREHGLQKYREEEVARSSQPLGDGPFRPFLQELHALQRAYAGGPCPIRIALVTARGLPAHSRVIHTLRSWGVEVDEGIFAGGAPKGPLLQAYGADIFFDDTMKNIDSANSHDVVSGHVPFGSGHGIVGASSVPQAA